MVYWVKTISAQVGQFPRPRKQKKTVQRSAKPLKTMEISQRDGKSL